MFEQTDRSRMIEEQILRFMDEYVYPNEKVYREQVEASGDPQQALVMPAKDPSEEGCDIPRNLLGTILDSPGIARGPDGRAVADA